MSGDSRRDPELQSVHRRSFPKMTGSSRLGFEDSTKRVEV